MRRPAPPAPPPMQLLTIPNVDSRRFFPAWIESDDHVPALQFRPGMVLPRVRAALPLRRVIAAATTVATTLKGKPSDARRLR
jgi:hypothetical protein